jgi:hypothetical protein
MIRRDFAPRDVRNWMSRRHSLRQLLSCLCSCVD